MDVFRSASSSRQQPDSTSVQGRSPSRPAQAPQLRDVLRGLGSSRDARLIREYVGRTTRIGEIERALATRNYSAKQTERLQKEARRIRARCAVVRKALLGARPSALHHIDTVSALSKQTGATSAGAYGRSLTRQELEAQRHRSGQVAAAASAAIGRSSVPTAAPYQYPSEKEVQAVIDHYYGQAASQLPPGRQLPPKMKARDILRPCRETGFPVEIILAVGAIESHMGALGRGATTKNMCNFGNDDAGNNSSFPTYEAGNRAFIRNMERCGYWSKYATAQDLIDSRFRQFEGRYYCPPRGEAYATCDFRSALQVVRRTMAVA